MNPPIIIVVEVQNYIGYGSLSSYFPQDDITERVKSAETLEEMASKSKSPVKSNPKEPNPDKTAGWAEVGIAIIIIIWSIFQG